MTVQSVTIDVEVPDGYEAVKVAVAKVGDLVVRSGAVTHNQCVVCMSPELILKPTKWRASLGDMYFFLTSELQVCSSMDGHAGGTYLRYIAGNYFQTVDEAKLAAIKIKALLAQ